MHNKLLLITVLVIHLFLSYWQFMASKVRSKEDPKNSEANEQKGAGTHKSIGCTVFSLTLKFGSKSFSDLSSALLEFWAFQLDGADLCFCLVKFLVSNPILFKRKENVWFPDLKQLLRNGSCFIPLRKPRQRWVPPDLTLFLFPSKNSCFLYVYSLWSRICAFLGHG